MQGQEPRTVTRRVVSRTAWTVPALAVLPTARAAAASCPPPPSLAYQGNWSTPTIRGYDLSRGIVGFNAGRFGASTDPAGGTGDASVVTRIDLSLAPNTTYRLSYPVVNWNMQNVQPARFVVNTGGGNVTTVTTANANPGTVTHTFTTDSSGAASITMGVFIQRLSATISGDDLLVGAPTLTCI